MPIYMGLYLFTHSFPFNKNVFKNKNEIIHSFYSCITMMAWLYFLLSNFDIVTLIDAYIIPCIIFGYWLFIVTMLHHIDLKGKYYDDTEWSFNKGLSTTFDRSYGYILDNLTHNIGTHFVHHLLFSKIPHYHLTEATTAIRSDLEKLPNQFYHNEENTSNFVAFYNGLYRCLWAEKNDDFYHHQN